MLIINNRIGVGVIAVESRDMGIYDRDYYRGQRGSYLEAFGLSGTGCKWLIALNIVAFVLEFVGRGAHHESLFVDLFILDPTKVLQGEVWRLISYAFLHDPSTWTHIVFNMLFLWWFGSDIEQIYGTREFVLFYLLAALLGGVFFTGWDVLTARPNLCLGASGAVMAVMVLYACHYPARIIYLFFIVPVPIWLFVVFYVAMDAFVFLSQMKSTTAVVVHLTGAAFAFLYYKSQFRVTTLWPDLKAWRGQRARPRLRVLQPGDESIEPVAVAAPPGQPVDEQLEAKVDAVLEKVARHGQASLTASEREILLRASEIYKRKRT
jgi:membrane associated rhomboid family serine protease